MSSSVWVEQVDTALEEYLPTIVKAYNSSSVLVPVGVILSTPESEFSTRVYPIISVHMYDHAFDPSRLSGVDSEYSRDSDSILMEKPYLPYNLFYQIDFWTIYVEDMNEMTRRWLGNIPKNFVLPVKDTSNNDQSCICISTGKSPTEKVLKKNVFKTGIGEEPRLFRTSFMYKIQVELDERPKETKYMVKIIQVVDTPM